MRNSWKVWLASALLGSSFASFAQAPATAPAAPAAKTAPMPAKPAAEPAAKAAPAPAAAAASPDMQTFVCKDGSTMSAASSKGACSGRKGIDQQATAKAAAGAKPAATAAPGGGAGKVWVNEDTKIYHCPGTRYYGQTKAGKYMSEAEAKAAGMHGANNKTCS